MGDGLNRKMMLAAAVFAGAAGMATLAAAQPGQCRVTGFGEFDCDVVLDGGGLSFSLPDGSTLAFTLEEAELGSAYLIGADAKPGQRPQELRDFIPGAEPGCWMREDGFEFCAFVFEGEGT